jgi:hypothetical protein
MTLTASTTSHGEFVSQLHFRLNQIARMQSITYDNDLSVQSKLEFLIYKLASDSGKKVVVIIDEYDSPVLELLEEPDEQKKVQKTLKMFYGVLKACDNNIRLVYITGIMKFTQMSLFSGLNNVKDISLTLSAGTMFGYTEAEILQYFSHFMELYKQSHNIDDTNTLMSLLREKVNGYTFGVKEMTLSESVFNPYAVNYVFDSLSMKQFWCYSGNSKFVVDKLKSINKIISIVEGVDVQLSDIESSCEIKDINTVYLLFYSGYLTIKRCNPDGTIHLKCPNEIITAMLLNDIFKESTAEDIIAYSNMPVEPKSAMFQLGLKLKADLLLVKVDSFMNTLKTLFAMIPYRIMNSHTTEAMYQLQLCAVMSCVFGDSQLVEIERQTNVGNIDLVLKDPSGIWIFEFKITESADVALQQILKKKYYELYSQSGVPVHLLGMKVHNKGTISYKYQLLQEKA